MGSPDSARALVERHPSAANPSIVIGRDAPGRGGRVRMPKPRGTIAHTTRPRNERLQSRDALVATYLTKIVFALAVHTL